MYTLRKWATEWLLCLLSDKKNMTHKVHGRAMGVYMIFLHNVVSSLPPIFVLHCASCQPTLLAFRAFTETEVTCSTVILIALGYYWFLALIELYLAQQYKFLLHHRSHSHCSKLHHSPGCWAILVAIIKIKPTYYLIYSLSSVNHAGIHSDHVCRAVQQKSVFPAEFIVPGC